MALIRYVGKKPVKEDNVAATGTVWQGHGDVKEVASAEAVEKLLMHPDIWEVVGAARLTVERAEKQQAAVKAKAKKGEKDESDPELPPVTDFSRMGKDAIERYARTHLGYEVDQRRSLKEIREKAQRTYARIVARGGK